MALAEFFSQVPRIQLRDPLSEFLGAADDGVMEYGYADAVRLAGHSCPTVAGSYLMVRAALRALYGEEVPERGAIEISMSGAEGEGTTGVIAQVFTLLTGAAAQNGFHGIGGRFVRNGLLHYGSGNQSCIAGFKRMDTGAKVDVSMDLSSIPPAPNMRLLMGQAMAPDATAEIRKAFGQVWQDRVRRLLLEHADDPQVIRVVRR